MNKFFKNTSLKNISQSLLKQKTQGGFPTFIKGMNLNTLSPTFNQYFNINAETIKSTTNKQEQERYADPAREPFIDPKWTSDVQPIRDEDYIIDCSEYGLSPGYFPNTLVGRMAKVRQEHGLVLLKNTGLTDLKDMKVLTEDLINQTMDYQGGANSRGAIEDAIFETGVSHKSHIHYHHEMVYLAKSVEQLAFMCDVCPEGKGYMYVSDGVKATDEILKTQFGKKLKEKGICYIRCLTDKEAFKGREIGWNGVDEVGVYNHWQTSFGVQTQEEVEKLANDRGLTVEWGENRYCKTRYYADAFEFCKDQDRNILYTSMADDSVWFDRWPGMDNLETMKSYETATMEQRPLKMTYGDGEEFTREEIQEMIDVYDKFGMPIKWQKGDVLVLCNYRWAHGRPQFTLDDGEQRKLGVVLGKTFKRVGQNNDKW